MDASTQAYVRLTGPAVRPASTVWARPVAALVSLALCLGCAHAARVLWLTGPEARGAPLAAVVELWSWGGAWSSTAREAERGWNASAEKARKAWSVTKPERVVVEQKASKAWNATAPERAAAEKRTQEAWNASAPERAAAEKRTQAAWNATAPERAAAEKRTQEAWNASAPERAAAEKRADDAWNATAPERAAAIEKAQRALNAARPKLRAAAKKASKAWNASAPERADAEKQAQRAWSIISPELVAAAEEAHEAWNATTSERADAEMWAQCAWNATEEHVSLAWNFSAGSAESFGKKAAAFWRSSGNQSFVTPRFCEEAMAVAAAVLIGATVSPYALAALGFAADGVEAESLAAWYQSTIGDVKQGSLFARLQSAGARDANSAADAVRGVAACSAFVFCAGVEDMLRGRPPRSPTARGVRVVPIGPVRPACQSSDAAAAQRPT